MASFRIGHGYDIHRIVPDRPMILGGVRLETARRSALRPPVAAQSSADSTSPPFFRSPRFAFSAAGFIAINTSG